MGFDWRRAAESARAWASARRAGLACAALLSVMSLQMLSVVARKSITVDEIVMIPAAYYHLAAGDFQLVHEHPPLSKILAGVPLLFIQPAEAGPAKIRAPRGSPEAKWAMQESFWEENRAAFGAICFWARVPAVALTAGLGVLLFAFARGLFGARAAVLAVALYSLEPTVLAHGRVVQTDVPAAFGYLLTFFALHRYTRSRTLRGAAFVGAAGGLAVLAKFSMLLVGPVLAAFFLWLIWRAPREGKTRKAVAAHAALAAAALVVVVNAAYFFQSRALGAADARWIAQSFPASAGAVTAAVNILSYLFPTDFVLGVFWQIWHNREGHPASLLGQYSPHGWWYYFPVAFSLKTTLPFLLLSLASLAWAAARWVKTKEPRLFVVLAPYALYTAFVLLSGIAIGVRYYLPAYVFLFVLGGALLDRLLASRAPAVALAFALLCWAAVEAARAYPDHMSYMNQLARGRPRWWYLSDSNVEWGDDVRALAEYLRARGETRVRGAFLAGFLTLSHYGVSYVDLLAPEGTELPRARYTAIGASFLNGSTVPLRRTAGRLQTDEERVNTFDAYRRREPEAVFGGSIYLFRNED